MGRLEWRAVDLLHGDLTDALHLDRTDSNPAGRPDQLECVTHVLGYRGCVAYGLGWTDSQMPRLRLQAPAIQYAPPQSSSDLHESGSHVPSSRHR
jgi:hypothetical protein